jgi:hypothetical protein
VGISLSSWGTEECFYNSSTLDGFLERKCSSRLTRSEGRRRVRKIASRTCYYGLIHIGGLFVKAS